MNQDVWRKMILNEPTQKAMYILEYRVKFLDGQKVRWPENLARAGGGSWEEALNFLDLLLRFGSSQNEGPSGKTEQMGGTKYSVND